MALTMTRTRTQTALTRLAQLVANIHGELAFVEQLIAEMPEHREVLERRKVKLEADRDALYVTLKQFDPGIEPREIGESRDWVSLHGCRITQRNVAAYVKRICAHENS